MRRILATRESIFKYGVYLPKSDYDANNSPERDRWRSGRELEWLRLKNIGAFECDWTIARMNLEYPDYAISDIGRLFYIYDYKFTGEHRVRLVFDGSRQSPNTYTLTYSPTVRSESIRLFHVYAIEMDWDIRQFDVPQAFLQSFIDHDIFVYPPRAHVERPGQILKLRLALYGAKQSSALFYKLLNAFLLSIGFISSTMDPCFYRRHDALIIVHVDDMRVAALPDVLQQIHDALYARFNITTSDGIRFLGMDVFHDRPNGRLTMGMKTYIQSTMDRFATFDVTRGCPYREIVGCLLWIVLCVVGPELVRVKDLARRSNNPTPQDYQDALRVLKRIWKRRHVAIIFQRGTAGTELIPSQLRPTSIVTPDTASDLPGPPVERRDPPPLQLTSSDLSSNVSSANTLAVEATYSHFVEHGLMPDFEIDNISEPDIPINHRFNIIGYTDASFAVGETKHSISGLSIFMNGTPIFWASSKQTIVADSTCAAEFIASSICCKYMLILLNMTHFLGFRCPKPYKLYTDSQASLSIASNANKMGQIRHIAIRYHLVRSLVINGTIDLVFCVTEDMIADLLTKMLSGASFDRLSARFYFIGSYTF
jgi:hypothetical protein